MLRFLYIIRKPSRSTSSYYFVQHHYFFYFNFNHYFYFNILLKSYLPTLHFCSYQGWLLPLSLSLSLSFLSSTSQLFSKNKSYHSDPLSVIGPLIWFQSSLNRIVIRVLYQKKLNIVFNLQRVDTETTFFHKFIKYFEG